MSKPFDSEPKTEKYNTSNTLREKNIPTLKLVVSNPPPVQEELAPPQSVPSNARFTAEVRNKGPQFYEMKAQDPSHYLECDLPLEIEENRDATASRTVFCHFPVIINDDPSPFLDDDEILYSITMIQFQMKILEELLLFCATHHASQLIIYTDDEQAEVLEIYHHFLRHQGDPLAENREQIEMSIPADQETFENWLDFMAETNIKFRQELWRRQRSPAIREYLKAHPFA